MESKLTAAAAAAAAEAAATTISTTVRGWATATTAHTTHIPSCRCATTATSTAATSTTTAKAGVLTSDVLEESRYLLVCFLEKFDQIPHDASVAAVEEGGGETSVSSTTGTTNAVHVVVDISWKIIIDDVSDIGNVQSS